MEKVYESSTALEAHMVKNLLETEGIASRIDGEHLQGGVGTLQAIGIVRVMVESSDFAKAKQILDQWETDQPSTIKVEPKTKSNALKGLVVGVVMTAGFAYWLFSPPDTTDGIDYNGDGYLDQKWIYKNNRISKSTSDRNLDGVVDQVHNYDTGGIVKSAELDNDFDGIFESRVFYRKGNPIVEETDQNQNGIAEYRVHFKNGQLDKIDFIDEKNGEIRKQQIYNLGKLISADFDSNGDGQLDTHYEYDEYEEIEKKI